MFIPTRGYGKLGFISDTPQGDTPLAAWGLVRNVRFKGPYIEKTLEPEAIEPDFPEDIIWGQQFYDGTRVRFVVASRTALYILSEDGFTWDVATRSSGPYVTPEGKSWQSFPWANTVVFNNGTDIPQVYNPETMLFVDLPKWGIVSQEDGTPGFDTQAKCEVIVPFKNYLVALDITWTPDGATESEYDNNRVWWSDAYRSPSLWLDQGPSDYHWDFNSSTNLSGQELIGLEDGPLVWAAALGEGLILYNARAATSMLLAGGDFVMDFRRLFSYGAAGQYCATEFNNMHYVVASDVMYVHDGNVVKQIAEDRVRDWFYDNVKNLESTVRVVTDYTQREVLVQFDAKPSATLVSNYTDPIRLALVYNYEDDNYSVIDAAVDVQDGGVEDNMLVPTVCMVYGLDLQVQTLAGSSWDNAVGNWDNMTGSWNSLAGSEGSSVRVSMYWVTNKVAYRANSVARAAPNKSFLVQKTNIDLDGLMPELTTNYWKHISQMYPHINGRGTMLVRTGWSPNLETPPVWGAFKEYKLEDGVPNPDVKVDLRSTGRYLAVEFRFDDIQTMRFSGADIDVKRVYGR